MKSIKSGLTVGVGLCAGSILLIGCVSHYLVVRKHVYTEFDQDLLQYARLVAQEIELEENRIRHDWLEWHTALGRNVIEFIQISNTESGKLVQSPSVDQIGVPEFAWTSNTDPRFIEFQGKDGTALRSVSFAFTPVIGTPHAMDDGDDESDETVVIEVLAPGTSVPPAHSLFIARETSSVDALLARLASSLLLGGLLVAGVTSLAIHWVTNHVLSPLASLSQTLENRSEDDIGAPLPPGDVVPVELRPLTRAFDTLLAKIRQIIQRERDFATNAAHELRTPAAGLHSTLELAVRKPRSSKEYERRIRKALTISEHLRDLLDRLMHLARLQSGQEKPEFESVHLRDELCYLMEMAQAGNPSTVPEVEWRIATDVPPLRTDLSLFRMIISNLLDNAVSYSPVGGIITIEASDPEPNTIRVSISNSTTQLCQDDIERMFDPFNRGTHASQCSDSHRHAGIGLGMCLHACASLGASLDVTLKASDRIEFSLDFPTNPEVGSHRERDFATNASTS